MTDSVRWAPGKKELFSEWGTYEIQRVLSQRSTLEKLWRTYLSLYRAPENQGIRRFPFEGAPLSRDTEILTKSGWRRIDNVRIGEFVLTRRDTDAALEWKPVRALPQRFANKLYHFKSRSIDLMVTEEHAMICQAQRSGKTSRIPAAQLWEKTGYFLPQHGTWLDGKKHEKLWGLPANAVAELIGWYLSEGSFYGNAEKPSGISISQSKTANSEKCWRLEQLFTRCGFTWTRQTQAYTLSKSTIPAGLFDLLVSSGKALTKRVPAVCWEWSADLLNDLLTGMVLGDGNIFDDYPMDTAPKVNYYTISRGLADDVQVLACLIGLHARVRSRIRVGAGGVVEDGRKIQSQHRSYEITICSAPRAKYDRSFREIVDYNDVAFCVTVDNHAIYARRNGIACWTGNSNRTYPFAAMTLDPILARYLKTLHAPLNLWTLQALNERWVPVAKPLQDFLQFLDHSMLQMWDVDYRVMDEMLKLGTAIYKVGWRFEAHPVTAYDSSLRRTQVLRTLNQPVVDHVPLAHFLVPPEALSVDPDAQGGARWVAERQRFYPDTLAAMARAQEPFLPNFDKAAVERVLKYEESSPTEHQQKVAELDKLPPTTSLGWKRPVELYELHCRFDTDGNGFDEDVVAVFHQPTGEILRATYNPWAHGKRPYHVVRYRRGDGFYGIGICEQAKMWQDTLSDVMNFNIDKILLSNAPMIGFREGANILPNEQIFPGKMWPLTNPKDDLVPFFLTDGRANFDLQALLSFLQEAGKSRVGVTDLQFGVVGSVPSRTPAATISSLLQEGNTRFDMSIQDARLSGLNHVGLQVLQLLQQQVGNPLNNPDGSAYISLAAMVLGQPEGQFTAQALELPFENIETGIGVQLTATSGTANRELAKQNQLALLQLYAQLGPQFLQLAQVVQSAPGSPMAETATQLFRGGAEFMQRLLEQFDVRNGEDLVPSVQALLNAQQAQSAGQPISPFTTAGQGQSNGLFDTGL